MNSYKYYLVPICIISFILSIIVSVYINMDLSTRAVNNACTAYCEVKYGPKPDKVEWNPETKLCECYYRK